MCLAKEFEAGAQSARIYHDPSAKDNDRQGLVMEIYRVAGSRGGRISSQGARESVEFGDPVMKSMLIPRACRS